MTVHVVSFQWPVPANYGGVIDVYHKIRALRNAGTDVALHSFCYRDRLNPDISLSPATRTHLYRRDMSPGKMVGSLPYIVASRKDKALLQSLADLPAGTPVIFEGLHTCGYLEHELLKDKIKIVRTHNVEHEYYKALSEKATGMKKMYLTAEARRLRRFEKVLSNADIILSISPADTAYFSSKFPRAKVIYVPCFFDDSFQDADAEATSTAEDSPYLLYHGNLGVEENIEAVKYILKHLLPGVSPGVKLIIAGKGASPSLRQAIETARGAELRDTPSAQEMRGLIENATVTLLLTNQNTGIKLKLLDTITSAKGHILANNDMVGDEALRPLLMVADSPREQLRLINDALKQMPDSGTLLQRRKVIQETFDTAANARRIIDAIDSLRVSRAL